VDVGAYVRHYVDVGASITLSRSFFSFSLSPFHYFPFNFSSPILIVLKQEICRIYRSPSSFFLVSNQELSFFRPSFDRQFLPHTYVHICCAFCIKSQLNSPNRVPHLYLYTWYTLLGIWKFLYRFQKGNATLHSTTHLSPIFLLKFYFQHGLKWDPSSYVREEMVRRWVWENEKDNIPFQN
jgi:hypothetical protein